MNTQEAINELLREKKRLLGAQGCSVQMQDRNSYTATCIREAISALYEKQEREKNAKLCLNCKRKSADEQTSQRFCECCGRDLRKEQQE